MAAEVTVIPDFWEEQFHSPRVPPGDDQPLTEETMDSGYEIGAQTIKSEDKDSYLRFLIGYSPRMKQCELIKNGHTFTLLAVSTVTNSC